MDNTNQPPVTPARATRLITQVIERVRYLHFSMRTEEAYVYWVRQFVRWAGLRHPRDLGREEVEGFLSHLANQRNVSASTHRQALSALGQDKFTVHKLFEEVAPRYAERPGGYTRILKLGPRRSDATEMVFLELV